MYNREYIVESAKTQIGIKENPAGSNKVKYNEWYYEGTTINAAWCGCFVSYIYHFANSPLPKIDTENGVILLNESFAYDYLMLEYVASPMVGQEYYLPMQFREALISWLR